MSDVPREPPASSDVVRVRVPLWAKLGGTFGVLLIAVLSVFSWLDYHEEIDRTRSLRNERLESVAVATAGMLDGDVIAGWSRQSDAERSDYRTIARYLEQVRAASGVRWLGIFGRRNGRYHYVLDTEEGNPFPINFPYFDSYDKLTRAFAGELVWDLDSEDDWGRWDSVLAPIRDHDGYVVAVLCVDMDADWHRAFTQRKLRQFSTRLGLSGLGVLLVATAFARYLGGPLGRLARAAHAAAGGDLGQRVEVHTLDEVGVLASTFNGMLDGLAERDRIREAFGRYVDPRVAQLLLEDPEAARPGGQLATVTILMSDLRGFTRLSAEHSPQEMVALLNAYLARMAEVIERHGGTINEFIGDAILALFGAPIAGDDDAVRAAACAAEMQQALESFNAELGERGLRQLEMGIGLNTGPVVVGNIGSAAHMKWGVVGDAVNMASRVESYTVGGEVLMTEETHAALGAEAEVRGPIEVRVKGRKEPLRLFALRRVGVRAVPGELRRDAELHKLSFLVSCYRMQGKAIDERALEGRLVGLSARSCRLELDEPLSPFDNVRVDVEAEERTVTFYAKSIGNRVHSGRFLCDLRLTSAPDDLASILGV